jgi:predicted HAD superfamily Cof-like phosphohydrolase
LKIHDCVRAFHEAMGVPVVTTPSVPSDKRVRLRASLVCEEFIETMRSLFDERFLIDEAELCLKKAIATYDVNVDLPELADGLCDLDYVVEGTRLEFGIPGEAVLEEVQRSNATKFGAPVRADGKILKGPNYSPPDIARVLARHGAKL